MFCASWRGNFPGGQMISAPSGGKVGGAFADPAAKNRTNLSRFGTIAAGRTGARSPAPKPRAVKQGGNPAMAKHIHRTILFTRPRHPHCAARRCGSGAGSHITAGALALALAPALWPSDAAAHTCDAPFSTDLIAGQTIDAGEFEVCNDDTTLTVTYEATFPWCLLKTDLHVATSKSGIPQNKNGHPTPGKFAYGEEYGGCLDGKASFEIPLDDIGDGVEPEDTVFIAAHAEVEHEDGREEGTWGKGTRFVERGPWAM